MFTFSDIVRVSEADQALADECNKMTNQLEELTDRLTQLETRFELLDSPMRTYDGKMRVATVRMPAELYEELTLEANARKTSLNQLCIAKLSCDLPEKAPVRGSSYPFRPQQA